MQSLFDALEVDPCDIISLVFAWKLGAKTPFEFSRTEFVNGCVSLETDSVEKLKAVLRTSLHQHLKHESSHPPVTLTKTKTVFSRPIAQRL